MDGMNDDSSTYLEEACERGCRGGAAAVVGTTSSCCCCCCPSWCHRSLPVLGGWVGGGYESLGWHMNPQRCSLTSSASPPTTHPFLPSRPNPQSKASKERTERAHAANCPCVRVCMVVSLWCLLSFLPPPSYPPPPTNPTQPNPPTHHTHSPLLHHRFHHRLSPHIKRPQAQIPTQPFQNLFIQEGRRGLPAFVFVDDALNEAVLPLLSCVRVFFCIGKKVGGWVG